MTEERDPNAEPERPDFFPPVIDRWDDKRDRDLDQIGWWDWWLDRWGHLGGVTCYDCDCAAWAMGEDYMVPR